MTKSSKIQAELYWMKPGSSKKKLKRSWLTDRAVTSPVKNPIVDLTLPSESSSDKGVEVFPRAGRRVDSSLMNQMTRKTAASGDAQVRPEGNTHEDKKMLVLDSLAKAVSVGDS